MSVAFRCQICSGERWWRIERQGDAVVSWACTEHLHEVCDDLQRFHERTELMVTMSVAPVLTP